MAEKSSQSSCLVIGGGISGLIAATVLQRHNIRVTVVDKGRGIGGRMATRRIRHPEYGEGVFDYGAQYFTVTDSKFQYWVNSWIQEGIVQEWTRGYSRHNQHSSNSEVCYRGVNSNRSIAQHLAQNLNVHTNTKVVSFEWQSDRWQVKTENNENFSADVLLLTPPIPQTLELLNRSQIELAPQSRHRLEQVVYHRCIAVLALLAQPSLIPNPGGMKLDGEPLSWIACNYKKGISPQGNAVTLHASPKFSTTNWEMDNLAIANQLLEAASEWLGSQVIEFQVHRWRFSQPQTVYGEPLFALTKPGLLVISGDGFVQPNIEGAVLSGLAAADHILKILNS
ncbi:NAD(P)/FAD-dependent oxidoreductase [Chlorogloeopsis sp. ULAP02]|uniref:NAD(P)/FAD-dependent oxidoreductase n=1 Tax=Chlorogloeopsis sp. ULAP02 TaxID=3107926 RepID=UPI0031375E38